MQQLQRFKKTKIGLIPEEWELAEFEDIVEFTQLGCVVRTRNNVDKLLLIKMGNLTFGGFDFNKLEYVDKNQLQNYESILLKEGDFLFNTRNSEDLVGKCAVWKNGFPEAIFDNNILRIRFKKDKIFTSDYISYLLNSRYGRKRLEGFIKRTTSVAAIYYKDLKLYKLPLPPIKEQQKIASILSNVDELIQKTEQIIEQTQRLKKGLMQRLFTKGIEHTNFKKTLIGELPTDWNLVLSRDLFSFVTSGSRGWAKYYSKVGAIFITVGNLQHENTRLNFSYIRKVNPPAGSEGIRTRVQQNDILISITADVGMVGFVSMSISEAYVNQHLALARPKNGNDFSFIAWYLASPCGGLKQFKQLQRGVTKKGLGLEDIKNVWVPLPPHNEQQKIANILDSLVNYVDFNFLMKSKLNRLKKGLMQQLLTGKIRVKI